MLQSLEKYTIAKYFVRLSADNEYYHLHKQFYE